MTNVMQKFLIYLSSYFCLTCIGLSFSTSSEADVQLRQRFKSPVCGVIAWARIELSSSILARVLTSYPGDEPRRSFIPASEDGLKESPKHIRQK
jgi:hypothetical protein